MQELELHSRQRLGTSHQDGILVWGHFDGDGRRGTGDGATGWAHLVFFFLSSFLSLSLSLCLCLFCF